MVSLSLCPLPWDTLQMLLGTHPGSLAEDALEDILDVLAPLPRLTGRMDRYPEVLRSAPSPEGLRLRSHRNGCIRRTDMHPSRRLADTRLINEAGRVLIQPCNLGFHVLNMRP
jgi:hypothetical protein